MARKRWLGAAITLMAAQCIWAVGATSCGGSSGADDGCPELPACGGDPTGGDPSGMATWEVASFCQYIPPLSYTVPIPLGVPTTPLAQTPPPTTAVVKSPGDACFGLVYEPVALGTTGNIKIVNLPRVQGHVVNGPVVFSSDGFYSVAVQTISDNVVHFPQYCLTAYGANPSCADLQSALTQYETMPNFLTRAVPFVCTDTPGGCDCSYGYEGTAADQGTWRKAGNILYFFSAQNETDPTVETTFCASPDGKNLSISGRDGQSLFNVKGLRSFTFTRSM
jgi:hypothetical protein